MDRNNINNVNKIRFGEGGYIYDNGAAVVIGHT